MYHIYSSSTFESQSETDFLPYVHSPADFLLYVRSPGGEGGGWSNGGKSQNPKTSLGLQTKRKKKSHAEFPNHKTVQKAEAVVEQVCFYFIRRTTRPGVRRNYHDLQIVLNTPKKSLLNQVTQKMPAKIFLPPKNPQMENLKPPKNPSIILVTWNLEYPLWGSYPLSLSIHRSDRV